MNTTVRQRSQRSRVWVATAIVALVYVVFRVMLLPVDGDVIQFFARDEAYFAIVARNLVEGRGYVNDAHEHAFMNPASLPMPYHNQNPLFPTATAAVSIALSQDIPTSAYLVSIIGSALMIVGVALLVYYYDRRLWVSLFAAVAATTFPTEFIFSFAMSADTISLGLLLCAFAAVVRQQSRWSAVVAGLLWGLAWLARGQTQLTLPAIAVFVGLHCTRLGRYPGAWKDAGRRLALMGIAALITVSPWLIHQARVWGNPLRSDSYYSVFQDILIAESGGRQSNPYWGHWKLFNNPDPPPGMAEVIRRDPGSFALRLAWGSAVTVKRLLKWWSLDSRWGWMVFLLGASVAFVLSRKSRWWRTPEFIAIAVLLVPYVLMMAIRYESFEGRYLSVLTSLFVTIAALGGVEAWTVARQLNHKALRRVASISVISALVLVWGFHIPRYCHTVYSRVYSPSQRLIAYRDLYRELNSRYAAHRPVVVAMPYYYTWWTSSPSVVFPMASDAYLLDYMDKYGARYILLTEAEIKERRPEWATGGRLPDGLSRLPDLRPGVFLFQRNPLS